MGSVSKSTKVRLDLISRDHASAMALKTGSQAAIVAMNSDDPDTVRKTILGMLEHKCCETSPVPLALAARIFFLQGLKLLLKTDYDGDDLLRPSLAQRSGNPLSMEAFFLAAKEHARRGVRFSPGHCHAAAHATSTHES